jgi:serine/threonine protein phosphatase PrpC
MFAVCDGHGPSGRKASYFAKIKYTENLLAKLDKVEDFPPGIDVDEKDLKPYKN